MCVSTVDWSREQRWLPKPGWKNQSQCPKGGCRCQTSLNVLKRPDRDLIIGVSDGVGAKKGHWVIQNKDKETQDFQTYNQITKCNAKFVPGILKQSLLEWEKGRRALYNKSENPSHKQVLESVLLATRTDTFLECRKTAEKVPALVCQVLFSEFWGEILTIFLHWDLHFRNVNKKMKWKISYCVVNDFVLISKDQFFIRDKYG